MIRFISRAPRPVVAWENVGVVVAVIAAALALLVLALAEAAQAHDWYSGLTVPGTRKSCCDERDCQPVQECSSPGKTSIGVVIKGVCVPVPERKILGMYSPDGQTHACWSGSGPNPFIRCVILPGLGS